MCDIVKLKYSKFKDKKEMNKDIINSIIDTNNYQGIVNAGTGAGLMSPDEKEALLKAQKSEMFIVRSSRVGSGRVTETNNFSNSNFFAEEYLYVRESR